MGGFEVKERGGGAPGAPPPFPPKKKPGEGLTRPKYAYTILPTPQYGQYLTHAHSHITPAVAAMDSCFVLVRTDQHGIVAVCMRKVLAIAWSW